jgi:putative nucleotidyltransferase with HDIG domain
VLTTALMGQYTADPGTLNVAAFWGHALAVGMVAEVMARNTGLAAPEEAFTAGILHDIGKLVMVQYLKDHFEAAATFATSRGIPLHRSEAEVFGFDHAMLGKRLAEAWRLPPGLVMAIAHHHANPGQEDGLSFVVHQANELCRDHGLWCGFEETEPGAAPPTAGTDDPIRAAALAKLGGFDKVVERANGFLTSSPVVPERRKPADIRQAVQETPPAPGNSPRNAPWAVSDRFPDRFGPFKRRA